MNRARVCFLLIATVLACGSLSAQINIVTVHNVTELKTALVAANSNGRDDIINFATATTYTLTTVDNTTNGANGLPVIGPDNNHSVTINGIGSTITRSGATAFRILQCAAGSRVLIENLTISNGLISFFGPGNAIGAGIYNNGGTLTVTTCAFNSNSVQGTPGGDGISVEPDGNDGDSGVGGAIGSSGTLTVTGSSFSNNSAIGGKGGNGFSGGGAGGNAGAGQGGAIVGGSSSLAIDSCVFTSNSAAGGNGGNHFGGSANGLGASGSGGAIAGTGTITKCTFTSNSVAAGNNGAPPTFDPIAESFGGALDVFGTVAESTFTNNSAQNGGALAVEASLTGGSLSVSSCLFQNNPGSISGGAIFVGYEGFLFGNILGNISMSDCTLSGNSAPDGAAVYNSGTANLTNCTIDGNNSSGSGAGALETNSLVTSGSNFSLVNSILKTGTTGANVANSAITSRGHNLSSDNAAGLLTATGDKPNTNPSFISDIPQDNGGPTKTIAIGLFGSGPEINAGDDGYAPHRDQRGYFRTGKSDIGAYEYFGGLVGSSSIMRSGNDAIVSAEVVYGHSYQLERKLNLTDASWTPIGNEFLATGNDIESATATGDFSLGHAFYHIRFTN